MARPLRVEFPGALYHVTARGDRREAIYRDDADRRAFLDGLGRVVTRFNWVIPAYCLMGNHYHLMVETPEANLARGMRQLNGVYTQAFNRRHDRVGHVLQGRYHAVLVEREAYLLELARYMVRNPVRAGLVSDESDWPWSSYRATAGMADGPKWLKSDRLLSAFSDDANRAQAHYAAFVADAGQRASPWEHLKGQIYLGSDDFVERMQSRSRTGTRLREVPAVQTRAPAPPLPEFGARHASRDAAVVAAYASGGYTMRAIGEHFGLHYSQVSRIVRRGDDATFKT